MSQAAVQRPPARFDASVVTGGKPAPFPGFVEPCHPTLGWRTPPSVSSAEHPEGEGAQIQERAGAMGVNVETPASPPNL